MKQRPVQRSVIMTCATTGSIHVPSQSPHLPITPAQIAAEGIAAWRAGASVLHLHARDPMGGGPGMTLDDRLAAPKRFSPVVQMIFGILGGIGAELDHLLHMLRTAQRLFGDTFEWSVLAVGRHQLPMGVQNALLGGNVRVGLEDSLTLQAGRLGHSNSEQVTQMRGLLEGLGYTIATPAEAHERLALKGREHVLI